MNGFNQACGCVEEGETFVWRVLHGPCKSGSLLHCNIRPGSHRGAACASWSCASRPGCLAKVIYDRMHTVACNYWCIVVDVHEWSWYELCQAHAWDPCWIDFLCIHQYCSIHWTTRQAWSWLGCPQTRSTTSHYKPWILTTVTPMRCSASCAEFA